MMELHNLKVQEKAFKVSVSLVAAKKIWKEVFLIG